ncbi:MAG: phosphoglycerol transferase I, partial [Stenotrophomonas sp.]
MPWILLLSLLLLTWLLLASRTWVGWKAGLMSLLLVLLSSWWLINKLSGDGLNAATLYHLGADMEGAGIADFKGYIAAYVALLLVSLLLP